MPGAQLLGLRSAASWLADVGEVVGWMRTNDFDRCLPMLKSLEITDVVFAGEPYGGEFRVLNNAIALMKAIRGKPSLWRPHTVLQAIPRLLEDANITLHSYLEYFPELRAEKGISIGSAYPEYGPESDLEAAKTHAGNLPWREKHQACIVDHGEVVMSERRPIGTNNLIRRFGESSKPQGSYPVLCKYSIEPFGLLDPPMVGQDTVALCIEHGIRAIVVEGGKTVLMQRDHVLARASAGEIGFHAC